MIKIIATFLVAVLVCGCSSNPTINKIPSDVDLTTLNLLLAYAEAVNIAENPTNYLGKVIRMKGVYRSNFFEETNKHYHFIVIEDDTACCYQGLEFLLGIGKSYPNDGDTIEVVGEYKTYTELGIVYPYIAVSDIKS